MLGGRRIVNTTQLIRKKVYILICINYMFRPTVATPDIKRKIDTRDLFINTPTQIYDFFLKSVINLMMATVGRNM